MALTHHSDSTEFLGALRVNGATRFRVWAPAAKRVEVVLESGERFALSRAEGGYFAGESVSVRAGALYKYEVDGAGPWPDPCSRFQPQGVHGPSLVIEADRFEWTDSQWRGANLAGQVIYELHIGTFTPEGTFDAAIRKLAYLRDLGITMLEIMPLSECPGRWNWGYDGVQLFAPYHVYGDHDAFKRFVNAAHAQGLAVILDVVYNHLGPDGNYLKCFSPYYCSKRYSTEWGEALNFDDEHCNGPRDFVVGNALYWLREFHMDGFRLDATQSIFDASKPHVLAELTVRCREAAKPRDIVFIAENEPQRSEHLRPVEQGGYGLDAMWNDDYHHTAKVALTGHRDGYFFDYTGKPQEFISALKRGFLYQGQYYAWQKQPRGAPTRGLPARSSVIFLQNHDQVANTFLGDRVHSMAAPASYRTLCALTLLAPQTPLLFMGEEFAASNRFMFFADHHADLALLVHKGRRQFVSQFRAYADPAAQALIRDPAAESTFYESKLNWDEMQTHAHDLALHRDLLHLRRTDPVISKQDEAELDFAVLSERAFAMRWFDARGDRLLIVNLDQELCFSVMPEPLLAPPAGFDWQLMWSSEDVRYGGHGIAHPNEHGRKGVWRLQGRCAVLMRAEPESKT
ncbi:MAG TPA: malto-oligosyltrehalose trehalohydrolase [Steroidobacteraceae bacterium]|nr:malto-oligosyltrehalose trehalohydrolase [Steroidobacteraceae bacterium]